MSLISINRPEIFQSSRKRMLKLHGRKTELYGQQEYTLQTFIK